MPDFNMAERQQIESKLKKCFILAVYGGDDMVVVANNRIYSNSPIFSPVCAYFEGKTLSLVPPRLF